MAFLKDRCARYPLTPEIVAACAPFSCGDKDLDEFFNEKDGKKKVEFDQMFAVLNDEPPTGGPGS